jgi:poly-gamma-glutamate capsule biosynthesis protein CapA/YwtB (metallophosphatase superfamily)
MKRSLLSLCRYILHLAIYILQFAMIPSCAPRTERPIHSPQPSLTLLGVGDVMVGRAVGETALGHTPDYPFEKVSGASQGADLVFGNLECAVTARDFAVSKLYRLKANPSVVPALSAAGFDVLSLANNHTMDCGKLGLMETISSLHGAGILTVGAGEDAVEARKPAIAEVRGLKVAFLAFTDVPDGSGSYIARGDSAAIVEAVALEKKQTDLVVISFHWGEEYATAPLDYQRALAHAVVDAGACLVIGHHPHVIEGVERYKRGLIAYSLGNFVFDQHEERGKRGLALACEISVLGVGKAALAPIVIRENQTRPPEPWEVREILTTVERYSALLGTDVTTRNGLGWVE